MPKSVTQPSSSRRPYSHSARTLSAKRQMPSASARSKKMPWSANAPRTNAKMKRSSVPSSEPRNIRSNSSRNATPRWKPNGSKPRCDSANSSSKLKGILARSTMKWRTESTALSRTEGMSLCFSKKNVTLCCPLWTDRTKL